MKDSFFLKLSFAIRYQNTNYKMDGMRIHTPFHCTRRQLRLPKRQQMRIKKIELQNISFNCLPDDEVDNQVDCHRDATCAHKVLDELVAFFAL